MLLVLQSALCSVVLQIKKNIFCKANARKKGDYRCSSVKTVIAIIIHKIYGDLVYTCIYSRENIRQKTLN